MGKGLRRSHKLGGTPNNHVILKQIYKAKDLAIEVDGATGVGWGTAILGDLPEGNILMLGAVSYMTFTGPTSASLDDDWAGDYGIGTTPASDATITAGDVDIIQSTAIAAATLEVSPRTRGISLNADTGEVHDNTDGSLEINLSVLVDDANIGADDLAFTADGELHLLFTVMGDD